MADRRLFDSSSMTPPPAPEIDAVTCTVIDAVVIGQSDSEVITSLASLDPEDKGVALRQALNQVAENISGAFRGFQKVAKGQA